MVTLSAPASMICRFAVTLVTCQSIHTCTTILTWLPYTPINEMLTVSPGITNRTLTAVWPQTIHTRSTVHTRSGCTIVDVDLTVHTWVSSLAYARVGISATDAYTVIFARVWRAFVDVHLAERCAVFQRTLTSICSRFINAFTINARAPLVAQAVRKFTLIPGVLFCAKALISIYLQTTNRDFWPSKQRCCM